MSKSESRLKCSKAIESLHAVCHLVYSLSGNIHGEMHVVMDNPTPDERQLMFEGGWCQLRDDLAGVFVIEVP